MTAFPKILASPSGATIKGQTEEGKRSGGSDGGAAGLTKACKAGNAKASGTFRPLYHRN